MSPVRVSARRRGAGDRQDHSQRPHRAQSADWRFTSEKMTLARGVGEGNLRLTKCGDVPADSWSGQFVPAEHAQGAESVPPARPALALVHVDRHPARVSRLERPPAVVVALRCDQRRSPRTRARQARLRRGASNPAHAARRSATTSERRSASTRRRPCDLVRSPRRSTAGGRVGAREGTPVRGAGPRSLPDCSRRRARARAGPRARKSSC